jgi:hypothetical protein
VHTLSLKLYIITPIHAQITNKRILVKDIRYNLTCFGALRHHHQGKNIKTFSDKTLDGWTQLWLKNVTSVTGLLVMNNTSCLANPDESTTGHPIIVKTIKG